MMRSLIFGIAQAAALIVAVISANAGESPRSASFCVNAWPPYTSAVDGKASGLTIAILREAARRADVSVRFVELPWKRCLQSVESGEIEVVIDAGFAVMCVDGSIQRAYIETLGFGLDDIVGGHPCAPAARPTG